MAIKTIVQEASALEEKLANVTAPKGTADLKQFCEYWPIVRTILEFAKKFTGAKADKAIDFIISWGNQLCPVSVAK